MKARIRTAQVKAALAANAELVLSYWVIGRDILASQKHQGWCAQVIDRFATDLQREFPKLTGYRLLHVALKAQLPKARQIKQLVAQMGVPHEK